MSKALAQKGELVLRICLKPGPAHDLTRTDLRDLIFGWMQVGWIRPLAIDHPDGHLPRRKLSCLR